MQIELTISSDNSDLGKSTLYCGKRIRLASFEEGIRLGCFDARARFGLVNGIKVAPHGHIGFRDGWRCCSRG